MQMAVIGIMIIIVVVIRAIIIQATVIRIVRKNHSRISVVMITIKINGDHPSTLTPKQSKRS